MFIPSTAIPPSPPPTPPPNEKKIDDKEKKSEKKTETVNESFRSWLHCPYNVCTACEENICHCTLYFDWLIGKFKDHKSMYRVPKSEMKRILYHEYERVANFVQFVYERHIGHINYPYDTRKRRVVPTCLEGMVENWVRHEYARQYRDWLWEQDLESRVTLSGNKRTYSTFKDGGDTEKTDTTDGKEEKVPQFDEDEMKHKYEEEAKARVFGRALDSNRCVFCSE